MQYNQSNVADVWNRVYLNFNDKRFSVWKESATPWLVQKIQFLKSEGVQRILDAGCGDGRNLSVFAETGFEITGIDVSKEAIKKAERVKSKFPDINLKIGSIEEMDFQNEFDAIICDFVLVHIPEIEKAVDNFYKALKENGLALLEFTTVDDPAFGDGEKIGKNEFLDRGIFLRFYTIDDIYKLLAKFEILCIDQINHEDPPHLEGYPRFKKHVHNSYFVLARKK